MIARLRPVLNIVLAGALAAFVTAPLAAQPATPVTPMASPAQRPQPLVDPPVLHAPSTARTVIYHPRDLVALRARVRYTTLIVLPDEEQVIEATCGDRDHWIVNVREGLVSIKPTQTGIASNLNLVTTSGSVYAFLLSEVSAKESDAAPDLTVYIEREDTALRPTPSSGSPHSATSSPRFVPAEQLEDFRQQAQLAREQAVRATVLARSDLDAGLTAYRSNYPLTMRFPYRIESRKGPFRIRAMWHDDHRTFIQTTAHELPALYEYQDRLPALLNFDVHDGIYIVPKVVRDGYLQLGKTRLGFRFEEGK